MFKEFNKAIEDKGFTINSLAKKSNIAPQDLYSAVNGKKPFYPNWRKRVSDVLGMNEEELFPKSREGDSNEEG